MKAFTELTGKVIPIDVINIDTDAILPKQFLKRIERSGLVNFSSMIGGMQMEEKKGDFF
jgi:3-isopropylmalate/(R)-2-methylmalate dehydratase small subunit